MLAIERATREAQKKDVIARTKSANSKTGPKSEGTRKGAAREMGVSEGGIWLVFCRGPRPANPRLEFFVTPRYLDDIITTTRVQGQEIRASEKRER